jgi:nucleotide-binding universal stress UspA family protein
LAGLQIGFHVFTWSGSLPASEHTKSWAALAKLWRAKKVSAWIVYAKKGKLDMNNVIDSPAGLADASAQPTPPFRLSHLLVPADFSPNSEKAMSYAIELARLARAKLTLLHVVPEPSALDYTMEGIPVDEIQAWQSEAATKLAAQLARAKLAYPSVQSVQTTALHPRDEIVRAAVQLSADLLILSTHGYTWWKHLLFGSDAEKVLEHAPCPVLIVR